MVLTEEGRHRSLETDKTRNYRNLLRAIEMPENFE